MTWKRRLDRKMLATGRLVSLIEKGYHQLAFDAVRDADWAHRMGKRKIRSMKNVIKTFYKRRYGYFFGRWKESFFESVAQRIANTTDTVNHKLKND